MEQVSKIFVLLGLAFLLLGLIFNLMPNLPKIPGDIYIDRPAFKLYIPFASAFAVSVIITVFSNFLK